MTHPPRPDIECEQQHAQLRAPDVDAAIEFYMAKLGFTLGFKWGEPTQFAGILLGRQQIFLQRGEARPNGCAVYFLVGDADALYEFQRASGAGIVEPPADREYGLRDYCVRDLNGYELSFGHPVFNAGDPIEIERVDVPLRLERRLAGVVRDLAERKRMSIDSFFEETLLHTLDGVEPHTRRDLEFIKKLKEKYAIDYDSHGSYRFVETKVRTQTPPKN